MADSKKEAKPSIFERLSSIDAAKLMQRKGNRNNDPKYIAWAVAWREVKRMFPDSFYEVIPGMVLNPTENGGVELSNVHAPYHTDGRTAWVRARVEVVDSDGCSETATVDLPIMDNRMNSIPADKVTSRDATDAQMRALVKALAMCGLGLEMWIKDDLLNRLESGEHTSAKSVEQAPAPAKKRELIILTEDDDNWSKVLNYVATNSNLPLEKIVSNLQKKYKFDDSVKLSLAEYKESNSKKEESE